MEELDFIKVRSENEVFLLQSFLTKAGKSLETFRYFNKRSFEVVKEHSYTVILKKGDELLGYGHLDKEDTKHWLGICITEAYLGLGYGKILLHHLVEKAKELKIKELCLSVDTNNLSAKKLYKQFNFCLEKSGVVEYYKKVIQ